MEHGEGLPNFLNVGFKSYSGHCAVHHAVTALTVAPLPTVISSLTDLVFFQLCICD